MKPATIKQKIRDVVASGVLGLPMDFKSPTLDKFCKGMRTYMGSFQSEKPPLTLPVMMYSLAMVPWNNRMAAQAGFSTPVAVMCCLRQGEYTVTSKTTSERFLTLRKVLYPVESASLGEGKKCFDEKDWEANRD